MGFTKKYQGDYARLRSKDGTEPSERLQAAFSCGPMSANSPAQQNKTRTRCNSQGKHGLSNLLHAVEGRARLEPLDLLLVKRVLQRNFDLGAVGLGQHPAEQVRSPAARARSSCLHDGVSGSAHMVTVLSGARVVRPRRSTVSRASTCA